MYTVHGAVGGTERNGKVNFPFRGLLTTEVIVAKAAYRVLCSLRVHVRTYRNIPLSLSHNHV